MELWSTTSIGIENFSHSVLYPVLRTEHRRLRHPFSNIPEASTVAFLLERGPLFMRKGRAVGLSACFLHGEVSDFFSTEQGMRSANTHLMQSMQHRHAQSNTNCSESVSTSQSAIAIRCTLPRLKRLF